MSLKPRALHLIVLGLCLAGFGMGSYLRLRLAPARPHAEVIVDHDLGTVWRGQQLSYTVKISNTGNAPLTLLAGKTSCGCTSATLTHEELAPGETGQLQVQINTNKSNEIFTITVQLETNDPENHAPLITFRGTRRDLIILGSSAVGFGQIGTDELPVSKSVGITFPEDVAVEEVLNEMKVVSDYEYIEPVLSRDLANPQIIVSVLDTAPLGALAGDFVVRYENIILYIPVTAQITGDLSANPSTLFFASLPQGDKRTLTCNINGLSEQDRVVVSPDMLSRTPCLSVESTRSEETYTLTVTLVAPEKTGLFSENLHLDIVRREDPHTTPLNIPILARITSKETEI